MVLIKKNLVQEITPRFLVVRPKIGNTEQGERAGKTWQIPKETGEAIGET